MDITQLMINDNCHPISYYVISFLLLRIDVFNFLTQLYFSWSEQLRTSISMSLGGRIDMLECHVFPCYIYIYPCGCGTEILQCHVLPCYILERNITWSSTSLLHP